LRHKSDGRFQATAAVLDAVSHGDLSQRLVIKDVRGDTAKFVDKFNSLLDWIARVGSEITRINNATKTGSLGNQMMLECIPEGFWAELCTSVNVSSPSQV
jgi:hypothetical protein